MRYAWVPVAVALAACSAAGPPTEGAEPGTATGSVLSESEGGTDDAGGHESQGPGEPAPAVVSAWKRDDVTMGASFLADDGEVLLGTSGALYATRGYDGGPVRRLDPAAGDDVWATAIGETPFVLAADRQRVVAFDSSAPELVALDADDGTVLWRRPVPEGEPPSAGTNTYAEGRATLTEDGMLLVGLTADGEGAVDAPLLQRLDPETGDTLWTATLGDGLDLQWQAPVLIDQHVVVQTVLSHPGSAPATPVYAIDVETGQVAWHQADVPTLDAFSVIDTVVPGIDGRVHLTHPGSGTLTVDATTGEILWTDPAIESVVLDGESLLAVRDGQLVRVDSATGAPRRTDTADRSPRITGLFAGPVGLFAVADGHLAVVDRVTGRLHRMHLPHAPGSQLLQVDDVLISRQAGAAVARRVDAPYRAP